MSMLYVTLIGHSIAVADNEGTAELQINQLVDSFAHNIVDVVRDKGEVRTTFRIRTVYVQLNQK